MSSESLPLWILKRLVKKAGRFKIPTREDNEWAMRKWNINLIFFTFLFDKLVRPKRVIIIQLFFWPNWHKSRPPTLFNEALESYRNRQSKSCLKSRKFDMPKKSKKVFFKVIFESFVLKIFNHSSIYLILWYINL